MHRRKLLKSSILAVFGVSFGFKTGMEIYNRCLDGLILPSNNGVKCALPSQAEQDQKLLKPNKWGYHNLTYFVNNLDQDWNDEKVWLNEIKESFDSWTAVTNVSFAQANDWEAADIIIGFSNRKRRGFGRAGNTLAWAQLPSSTKYNGQLWNMYDEAESWILPDSGENGILFRGVCAHEIGHLLGLGHSKYNSALMYPYYSNDIWTPQEKDDIPRIQRLYGKKK